MRDFFRRAGLLLAAYSVVAVAIWFVVFIYLAFTAPRSGPGVWFGWFSAAVWGPATVGALCYALWMALEFIWEEW